MVPYRLPAVKVDDKARSVWFELATEIRERWHGAFRNRTSNVSCGSSLRRGTLRATVFFDSVSDLLGPLTGDMCRFVETVFE